ncbi:MAG TPA: metal-dependent hydrolase [Chthoniobacterales bacterium]|nr:metal-dependent hydrolase [Chthoniobacterales bacterium]
MPTIISHAAVAVALMAGFPARSVPRRLTELGVAVSIAPDIDVIGSRFGIEYGDLLGHRGLTHSILFAALLASVALLWASRRTDLSMQRRWTWLYLFLAAASHGLLDAFTDGGLGVAFFSPFNTGRYFFPVTPISVSPVGLSFFSGRGISVLLSEFVWVWLPALAFSIAALLIRRICQKGNIKPA